MKNFKLAIPAVKLFRVVALLAMTAPTSALALDIGASPDKALARADAVRIRYFNPEVSFRTVFGVGDVNSNLVDFDVTIVCRKSCGKELGLIATLLNSAQRSSARCFGPPYARLDLLIGSGRSVLESLLVDHTGRCAMFGGETYVFSEPITLTLFRTPMKDW